jgi:hypothetical protein
MTMSNPSDRILPDAVRRIVIHRAVAGSYDPHETDLKAIDGARAAARRSLGKDRLTHREAVEVDALVLEARARAQRGELAAFFQGEEHGPYVVTQSPQQALSPSRDTSLILAAIAQLVQLMLAMLAVMTRRSPAALAIEPSAATLPLLPPPATPEPSFAMVRASASSMRPS